MDLTTHQICQAFVAEFVNQRTSADRAITQAPVAGMAQALGTTPEDNSILVLMKHTAWALTFRLRTILGDSITEVITRDQSLTLREEDNIESVGRLWNDAWDNVTKLLELENLAEEVDVRGKMVSKLQVLVAMSNHISGHVGQIILLAKHFAGDKWTAVTVAKAQS